MCVGVWFHFRSKISQRYSDGACNCLFPSFFMICHPYIPLHFRGMIFYTCSNVFWHVLQHQRGQAPRKNSARCRFKHRALVVFRALTRGERARGRPLRNWKAELTKWRRTTLTFRNSLPFYRVYLELTEAVRLVPMHTSADHGAVLYENQTLYSLQ